MRKKKQHEEEASSLTGDLPERRRITPIDVQQKEFRLGFRGYNERDVDAFLDEITEEFGALIDENRRLREGAGGDAAPAATRIDAGGEPQTGDELLARAREEAATIVREAEARAAVIRSLGSIPQAASAQAMSSFILKERAFLQSLAGLIQGHAETVKDVARSARERSAAREAPAAAPAAPAEPLWTRESEETAGAGEPAAAEEPEAVPVEGPAAVAEPHVSEPDVSEPEPEVAARRDDVKVVETAPARQGSEVGSEASLRELFWGED